MVSRTIHIAKIRGWPSQLFAMQVLTSCVFSSHQEGKCDKTSKPDRFRNQISRKTRMACNDQNGVLSIQRSTCPEHCSTQQPQCDHRQSPAVPKEILYPVVPLDMA